MKQKLTVGKFKADICSHDTFRISVDDLFSPFGFKAIFDRIIVNNSASPYIVLQNEGTELCISHIKSIGKQLDDGGEATYTVVCQDYSVSDDPVDVSFTIKA